MRILRSPDEPAGTGGGAAAPAPAPAPAAAAPSPSPSPAAAAPSPSPSPSPAPSPEPPAADWNPKWREIMSAGDEKEFKQLGRYGSPVEVWKKARSLEARLSSGELRPALKDNASEAELKEWRDAHGIPEKADGYLKDMKLAEGSKEMVEKYVAVAHAANMTPGQVQQNVKFMQDMAIEKATLQREKDVTQRMEYEDALHKEWGGEYRPNLNAIHGLLDGTTPAGFKEKLLEARLPDGTLVGTSPDMLKMLLSVALARNPVATIVPGGSGNPMKGIEDRIKEIEGFMHEGNGDKYWKSDAVQAEYQRLIEAREGMKERV